MSSNMRKNIIMWILGFLIFVAAVNTIDAAVIWSISGIESMVPVYILGDLIPAWKTVSVIGYFWTSLIVTFVLLGMVTLQGSFRPRLELEVNKMASRIEDEMVATRGALESTRISLFARIEDEKIARQDMITNLNESASSVRKETLAELERQNAILDKEQKELMDAINELRNLKQDMLDFMAEHNKSALASENSSRIAAANSERSMNDLFDLRKKIEKLEAALNAPKPDLKSENPKEEIKGPDSRLAQDP